MRVRCVVGPAGSGKTFRCLAEARRALAAGPEGRSLLVLAPKQSTYQLERQLLAEKFHTQNAGSGAPAYRGYTRLHVLSFERLAYFILDRLQRPAPQLLDEEGRLMVLRGLLARKRDELKLFRASARLTGFAQQLSLVLRELQRHQLTPQALLEVAERAPEPASLAYKLQDLSVLLRDYQEWLAVHNLKDVDCLLTVATEALLDKGGGSEPGLEAVPSGGGERRRARRVEARSPRSNRQLELGIWPETPAVGSDSGTGLGIEELWVDGFVEWSPQELELLGALVPQCGQATLTFCLDGVPTEKKTWLSPWSVVRETFEECRRRLERLPGVTVEIESLPRRDDQTRFCSNPVLAHLERHWSNPVPYEGAIGRCAARNGGTGGETPPEPAGEDLPSLEATARQAACATPECAGDSVAMPSAKGLGRNLRVVVCANPEAEVKLAAREIVRYVRGGGRYRDVTVLMRRLEAYHETIQRLFARYEIPCFLDRRESVSHHPLAELTRSALRTVLFQWRTEDWFAALKTGLVPAEETEIDRLENEALARGWEGTAWQRPIVVAEEPELSEWLAELQPRLMAPFQRLALALGTLQNRATGPQLAEALRGLWRDLEVETRLEAWAAGEASDRTSRLPASVHGTVWEQFNRWLENVELAFATEALSLREWLPILDAGLGNVTVGIIPPALDQVLVGALDRSRDPDVRFALVLGMNEGVFPAPPEAPALLSEADREELEKRQVRLGATGRRHMGRERFYGYLACTRAQDRVLMTCALQCDDGSPLNRSPFLTPLQRLFPGLVFERAPKTLDWQEIEHPSELIVPLLKAGLGDAIPIRLPLITNAMAAARQFERTAGGETLAPDLAEALYGPVLRTSVSRMEQYAACPFKFFVHSGLRAEERRRFELDRREQGSFQHDVLAIFHQQLQSEQKRWRDITPEEARKRIEGIARVLRDSYRDGLLKASEESRFLARVMTESLESFAATLVEWMRGQYEFDPAWVELGFGEAEGASGWGLALDEGHRLELNGRIDRVDLWHRPGTEEALCVVLDYKSSQKRLDNLLLEHGLQLQLPAYLNVLRHWPDPRRSFGVARLVPAGVFYINLQGKYERARNRQEALTGAEEARKLAYRHTGRFDAQFLPQLDSRPAARKGDQFNYQLTKEGRVNKRSQDALTEGEFLELLDGVERNLKRMGLAIYGGQAQIDPYRKGKTTACSQCDYRAICRIDPWVHRFRVLRETDQANA